MKTLFIWLFLACIAEVHAQDKVLTNIPATGKVLDDFIPAGYDTLTTEKGDLNKDGKEDYVLVLRNVLEDKADTLIDFDSVQSSTSRIMLILFKESDHYKLAAKTNKAILCHFCGGVFGEPFEGVSVQKGVLMIYHYGGSNWRWSYTHKFRYQQNDFYLIGETRISYWSVMSCELLDEFAGTDFYDVNYLTGSYQKKKVSYEGCKLLVNKKGKQPVRPLKKLTKFDIEN